MYTFQALANINTVDDHLVLYITLFISVVTLLIIALKARDQLLEALIVLGPVCAIVAIGSFTFGRKVEYANTPVNATLVGFVAEGYNIPEVSGKQTRHVDHHETYVVYEVNGERVMLPSKTGVSYPKQIILYKN